MKIGKFYKHVLAKVPKVEVEQTVISFRTIVLGHKKKTDKAVTSIVVIETYVWF